MEREALVKMLGEKPSCESRQRLFLLAPTVHSRASTPSSSNLNDSMMYLYWVSNILNWAVCQTGLALFWAACLNRHKTAVMGVSGGGSAALIKGMPGYHSAHS
eukprot:167393-Pelagomonas_calceolata.AAC.4